METLHDFLALRPIKTPKLILQIAWYVFLAFQALSFLTAFYYSLYPSAFTSLSAWFFLLPKLFIDIIYVILIRILIEMAAVVLGRENA